ncbi:Fibropellin-1 [Acipenser ruthenus]|uniref:Fibropellin-1 n=1 Tax=Acipenser ruthenus TaxID=7906 RepID=A0A444UJ23_ACIRT|nr:Fibropellin-1 [Acipenser ruthenus]
MHMSHRCICPDGFTGSFCETDIDYCIGNLCSEHGTCLDQLYNYTCHCMLGHEEHVCETDTNECTSLPCENGATCVDLIGDFSCQCAIGFEGNNCEIEVDECLSDPCQNGATCSDELDAFGCLCPDGIEGVECETDRREKNRATCIDQPGNYFCQCLAPFKGSNCGSGHVRPVILVRTGLCVEEVELDTFPLGFHCQCAKGFAGPHCEINVSKCSSDSCLSGYCCDGKFSLAGHSNVEQFYCYNPFTDWGIGVGHLLKCSLCTRAFDWTGADCIQDVNEREPNPCLKGFEGIHCEIDINECISSPCQNHGHCLEGTNGYRQMSQTALLNPNVARWRPALDLDPPH